MSPLKRLSALPPANPGRLSAVGVPTVALELMAKLPNAPIGEKPALCGVADHGYDPPPTAVFKGPVAVRLRPEKGARAASVTSAAGFSSDESPVSLKSVLLLVKEGGGELGRDSTRAALTTEGELSCELEGNG
jgi:hypothetical protein